MVGGCEGGKGRGARGRGRVRQRNYHSFISDTFRPLRMRSCRGLHPAFLSAFLLEDSLLYFTANQPFYFSRKNAEHLDETNPILAYR